MRGLPMPPPLARPPTTPTAAAAAAASKTRRPLPTTTSTAAARGGFDVRHGALHPPHYSGARLLPRRLSLGIGGGVCADDDDDHRRRERRYCVFVDMMDGWVGLVGWLIH